ncbi:cadherin-like domain-containing protein [Azohydromonas australica]|uniref:cadherin-like domain-containing protein n=1 Tax=Azohydromonas australica TaxID=364039 RepID=UPI0004067FDD|nr:cadherin-like domain-containing protein [Azohydromonas australica]
MVWYVVTWSQLVQGFSDPDSYWMDVFDLRVVEHGHAERNADSSWTITPDADFNGQLKLEYSVTDGEASSALAELYLTVAGVNDAPVLDGPQAVLAAGAEDTDYVVTQEQLALGFTDSEGDVVWPSDLTVENARVSLNEDSTWTIRPYENVSGQLELKYIVSNAIGTAPDVFTEAKLYLDMLPVNDAPALTGPQTVLAKGAVGSDFVVTQGQLLEGFSDVDSESMWVTDLAVQNGTAVSNGDGSWTISPTAEGELSLIYSVTDGIDDSTQTQLVTLIGPNSELFPV